MSLLMHTGWSNGMWVERVSWRRFIATWATFEPAQLCLINAFICATAIPNSMPYLTTSRSMWQGQQLQRLGKRLPCRSLRAKNRNIWNGELFPQATQLSIRSNDTLPVGFPVRQGTVMSYELRNLSLLNWFSREHLLFISIFM